MRRDAPAASILASSDMENLSASNGQRNGADRVTDVELLCGIASRDPDSLARLYDRFGRIIFSLASRLLSDARDSEEVTQDVFLSVWTHPLRYRSARSAPLTWLAAITRHKCIDRLRKSGRRIPCLKDLGGEMGVVAFSSRPDPFAMTALGDLAKQMRECLDKLPETQRVAVECSYFDFLSLDEIARRLEIPEATVKSRIRLAMEKLKQTMISSRG